jgi:ketosteroid isomerase-like protein
MNLWSILTASVALHTCSGFQGTLPRSGLTGRSLLRAAGLDQDDDQRTSIIEKCFDAFNRRDLNGMVDCFTDDCQYEDTIFEGKAVGKQDIRRRFERSLHFLPPFNVVTDNVACDPTTGKVGCQWHLETENGMTLPFSRGTSFYTTDLDTGLIQTGFRVMETPFKPDDVVFNALIVPTKIMEALSSKDTSPILPASQNQEFGSIIERAYDGWNRRDIDAAIECFTDDIILEDTLYFNTISGKEALRKHYDRVANQLPRVCTIVLDEIAESPSNGNIGIRWHLQVENSNLLEGWSRGCSMYTTDPKNGLVKSGIDITESPFKVNERGLDLLLSPLQILRRRSR